MILTGYEIARQRSLKRIVIEPFERQLVNPNSYNYRLGNELLEFPQAVIDVKQPLMPRRHRLSARGFLLLPERLYLGHTVEIIGSDFYSTSLIGRSSMGRLGLWLQVTADLGHTGTAQRWTLEMKVVQPLWIYPGMKIGQVSFWKVAGRRYMYKGRYAGDLQVQASRLRQEEL